ncbi:MAG: dihydrodipicolinate synthase family protein [Pyrinomonadaceae bacterium]
MAQSSAFINADHLQRLLTGGLIPAAPVTLDANRKLYHVAHDSYIRYLSSQRIAGVAVWAHTGRGLMLDAETAHRVMDDWRKAIPGKVLIAGVGARTDADNPQRATMSMAEAALDCGADLLLAYPPRWLFNHPQRDKLIIEHHSSLCELGSPIVLFYLYEAAGGISYTQSVLDELLNLPEVVGIKVATLNSVMTYQDIARIVQTRHPNKLLITGEDRFLGYSLRLGARAALVGLGAVCAELQSELIESHVSGNSDRFLELSDAVDRLAQVLFLTPMECYIKRILMALAYLGVIPRDAANDPWGPELPRDEFEKIGSVLTELAAYAN